MKKKKSTKEVYLGETRFMRTLYQLQLEYCEYYELLVRKFSLLLAANIVQIHRGNLYGKWR